MSQDGYVAEAPAFVVRPGSSEPRTCEKPGRGGPSTSEPHPSQDIEADPTEPPERDKLDE